MPFPVQKSRGNTPPQSSAVDMPLYVNGQVENSELAYSQYSLPHNALVVSLQWVELSKLLTSHQTLQWHIGCFTRVFNNFQDSIYICSTNTTKGRCNEQSLCCTQPNYDVMKQDTMIWL